MTAMDPDDARLSAAFATLAPNLAQTVRMESLVLEGLERQPPSLVAEWWGLLSARPVVNTGWVIAATLVLFVTTPLGAVPGLLAAAPESLLPRLPRTSVLLEHPRANGQRKVTSTLSPRT